MKLKIFSIIFFIIFANIFYFSNVHCQNYETKIWTELGPTNLWAKQGRINCLAVNPNNENIIFAGTPSGSLWQTIDGGKNWFSNTDFLISNGVSAIAIDPQNTDIIYIGTGDKAGQAYQKEGNGIFKSTDNGKTWENINKKTKFTNIYEIIVNKDNTNIIYTNSVQGFYKTTDAGKTWKKIYDQFLNDIEFNPTDNQIIYATTDSKFLIFKNGGENIETITNGIEETGIKKIVCSNSDSLIIYLMNQNKGFYKSIDFGQSFEKVSDCSYSGFYTQSHYCYCLEVDKQNSETIYYGARNLWRSLDGGKNWEQKNSLHLDNHFILYNQKNNRIYCANDGGICYSDNKAQSWTNINNGLGITQIYEFSQSADGNTIIIGTQDNGASILKKDILKDSISWKNIILADVMRCEIDYSDDNSIYFSCFYTGGNSSLIKTNNLGNYNSISKVGQNGIDSNEYFLSRVLFKIDKLNSDILYLGGVNLYKCINIKNENKVYNWQKITEFDGIYTLTKFEQSYVNQNFAYLLRGLSFFYYTENLNSENVIWTKIKNPVSDINSQINSIIVDYKNDDTLFIIQDNKIWKSENKGSTWTNISYNLKNLSLNCLVLDQKQEEDIYVGTSAGIYYKNKNMTNWQFISKNLPPVWVTDLEIFNSYILKLPEKDTIITGKLRVSTYGRGLWETDLIENSEPDKIFVYEMPEVKVNEPIIINEKKKFKLKNIFKKN